MLKRANVNYVMTGFLSRDSLLSFHFEVQSIRSSINTSLLPNLLNKRGVCLFRSRVEESVVKCPRRVSGG